MLDIAIVGGGIVGTATAFQIVHHNPHLKVALFEKESALCQHQTGHNSGVIHSGIYYKPGSLKAKNCIEGYKLLLEFARANDIPFTLCGKVIVATQASELAGLTHLYERGLQNGLSEIKRLNAAQLNEIEPYCSGIQAIHVPYTGIIDYSQVTQKMAYHFQNMGGSVYTHTQVKNVVSHHNSNELITNNGAFPCKIMINCAGLYSDEIAQKDIGKIDLRIIPFRGEYYMLKKEKEYLVKTLIYPVPDPNFPFLGVHFTNLIQGGVEAGPNAVFAFKKEGYRKLDFDWNEFYASVSWPGFQKVALKYWKTGLGEYYRSFSKQAFTRALQRLVPDVQVSDLIPAGAGVRAQACDIGGALLDDFKIIENKHAIHVCNAPSPAATSSLSIGKTIAKLALQRF